MLVSNPDIRELESDWKEVTKDQLWHRLSEMHQLLNARLSIGSKLESGYEDLKTQGQQNFDLLCSSAGGSMGFTFHLAAGPGLLLLRHWQMLTFRLEKASWFSTWEIDDAICIACPPQLHFDDMPNQIAGFYAHIASEPSCLSRLPSIAGPHGIATDPSIRIFAYCGNLDVATCVRWLGEPLQEHKRMLHMTITVNWF